MKQNILRTNNFIMKYAHYSIIVFFVTFLSFSPSRARGTSIVPQPVEMTVQSGIFSLADKTCLQAGKSVLRTAEFIQKRLKDGLGLELNKGGSRDCSNSITLDIDESSGQGDEAYTLVIDYNITIKASNEAGLFYGAQSLLQLMPAEVYGDQPTEMVSLKLSKVTIKDQACFSYRGSMVDISRHFVSKEELIKIIDMMAMHKLNVLHLHLTDDHGWRIEIKSYPKLTSVGPIGNFSNPSGPEKYFLTQDEIRCIVSFVATRHVMVVPEIEISGHSRDFSFGTPRDFRGMKRFPYEGGHRVPGIVQQAQSLNILDSNSLNKSLCLQMD